MIACSSLTSKPSIPCLTVVWYYSWSGTTTPSTVRPSLSSSWNSATFSKFSVRLPTSSSTVFAVISSGWFCAVDCADGASGQPNVTTSSRWLPAAKPPTSCSIVDVLQLPYHYSGIQSLNLQTLLTKSSDDRSRFMCVCLYMYVRSGVSADLVIISWSFEGFGICKNKTSPGN